MKKLITICAMTLLFFMVSSGKAEVIYFNNFENSSDPLTEWSSNPQFQDTADGITGDTESVSTRFLGQFSGNQSTSLTLNNLPAHTDISLSFDMYVIRTWDGTGSMGGETFDVDVQGGSTLLDKANFSNMEQYGNLYQSYPGMYPTDKYNARTGAYKVNKLGFFYNHEVMDSIYHFSFTFPHLTSSLVFNFSGFNLQDSMENDPIVGNVYDESWGLDNVIVTPEPATLFLLGFGGLALLRKRRA